MYIRLDLYSSKLKLFKLWNKLNKVTLLVGIEGTTVDSMTIVSWLSSYSKNIFGLALISRFRTLCLSRLREVFDHETNALFNIAGIVDKRSRPDTNPKLSDLVWLRISLRIWSKTKSVGWIWETGHSMILAVDEETNDDEKPLSRLSMSWDSSSQFHDKIESLNSTLVLSSR